jgi:hypothetical protein
MYSPGRGSAPRGISGSAIRRLPFFFSRNPRQRIKQNAAPGARGIEAESPEDLQGQIRGLGAQSPVCGALRRKRAHIFLKIKYKKHFSL